MHSFDHDGFELVFFDEPPKDGGRDETVLLIHGFASSARVNWVGPGWIKTLTDAGYRAVALDNRGHGASEKSYSPLDYTPSAMAADAAALVEHLNLGRVHVMGYSMGARIATFMALARPDLVGSLILGGLGQGMVDGVGDWDPIADALVADDPGTIQHPRARMFRAFADQTGSDREALAACIATSRELLSRDQVGRITCPVLVAVGSEDDIGGRPEPLAAMMPRGEAFVIEGRDHMLSVGDRAFKERVLRFLEENPLA
jgi:pimeloyl-ACP methyl ester carboxylesterase